MKRNYCFLLVLLLLSSCSFFSCKKYLSVLPEDKVLEGEAFKSRQGIQTVLNGLYIGLTKNELYGENLTLSTIEIMAQRYNVPSTHSLTGIATYAYGEDLLRTRMEGIWTNSYSLILNINAFLENLEKYKGVLDDSSERMFKGEATALRAFLHLDLLRLYAPRYTTADSTKSSLPYYTESKTAINPLLPANVYMDQVLSDLNVAADFLKNDPVINSGVQMVKIEEMPDFQINNRNYRLNYYAVLGLKARALLYRNDRASALKVAKEVIAAADHFKWTTTANALNEKANPDRVFSTEMIFGILNTRLYARYTALFDPTAADATILAPLTARLNTVYENNENDYRFNLNWQIPTTGVKAYRTFYKYADIVDKAKNFRFTIPLLKISEIYLIAAESEAVSADGIHHLNVVRFNRGLTNLATTANILTELQKEYQKEFFGEGQLFYYYKRRNITSVGNGSSTANTTINFNVPMPLSESQYR